ncbi:MAG: glycosyltransferase [Planctomycetes bacterium]|nr:glycosyltransferase [Planctomycetota bacterium]
MQVETKQKADVSGMISQCPLCASTRLYYLFSIQGHRAVQCDDCRLLMLNPQPAKEELEQISKTNYAILEKDKAWEQHVSELKRKTASQYLDLLIRYSGGQTGKLIEIGCMQGDFLIQAVKFGFDVTGLDNSEHACEKARQKLNGHGRIICGEVTALENETGQYDVCVLSDVIQRDRDPKQLLKYVHKLLKPEGVIFVATPSLDSRSAKLLKEKWMEFKPDHLFYFNEQTIQTLFFQCGFGKIVHKPCVKILSVDYISEHFQRYPVAGFSARIASLRRLVPKSWRRNPISVVPSGMIVMARAQEISRKQKLSLVVPVYNEAATVETSLNSLLVKQVDGLDIEIILVESNSTDGSREIVLKYKDHPRVKLVLEEWPQGKGHAVRTGFMHATGDFMMIQDADLEYDLEDYEALLEPLMKGHEAFVLGARHGGRSWKMRQFTEQVFQGFLLNVGHWFFTALIDILFGLRLKDPFTMYKVFRRDCLYGLEFECNRFDFDFELLIKLVRKGYKPIEIPVNYRSRSFKQGKKVSMLRDPLTWLRALVKYRFSKIDILAAAEKANSKTDLPKQRTK